MTIRLRTFAVHLVLVAALLRALVPNGWMPDLAGHGIVICSVDGGAVQPDHEDGKKPDHQAPSGHEVCPFGAAPHLATVAAAPGIATPAIFFHRIDSARTAPVRHGAAPYLPQSPRAPPSFV